MKELKALFRKVYLENINCLKFSNIYRVYLLLFLLLFTTCTTFSQKNHMNEIKIGNNVPSFTLPDQNGNLFDINSVLGKKNLVIYFYPKDDSPGCTAQACSFQDQFEVFNQADAVIIGISGQSVESHKEFAEKNRLKYTLLSDTGNTVRRLFGVPGRAFGLIPGRVTYVADRSGKVVYIFDSQTETQRHADEALKICLLLKRTDNVNI